MFDQIDRIVRRANPVPDPNTLRSAPTPTFMDEVSETIPTSEPDGGTRRPGRLILIGAAAAVVIVLVGVSLALSGDPAPIGEASTTTSPSTTTTAPGTTTTSNVVLPAFPPERTDLVQGGETWVVVLAAAVEYEDPVLTEAVDAATAAGYSTGPTDCDSGAATALGLDENDAHYYTVSVYFETEQDAHDALTAFQARDTDGGVALVQTFCLD